MNTQREFLIVVGSAISAGLAIVFLMTSTLFIPIILHLDKTSALCHSHLTY